MLGNEFILRVPYKIIKKYKYSCFVTQYQKNN